MLVLRAIFAKVFFDQRTEQPLSKLANLREQRSRQVCRRELDVLSAVVFSKVVLLRWSWTKHLSTVALRTVWWAFHPLSPPRNPFFNGEVSEHKT